MIGNITRRIAVLFVAAVTGLTGLAAATSAAQASGSFGWSVTIGSGHYATRHAQRWDPYPRYGNHHHWKKKKKWQHPHYSYRPHVYVPAYRYVPRYVQPRYAPRVIRLTAAHVSWCYNRYRSYRDWDNSFNPGKNRPRQQCYSPYS